MQDREGLATDVTLVGADTSCLTVQFADLADITAAWTTHAVGPKQALKIAVCTKLVREQREGFAGIEIWPQFHDPNPNLRSKGARTPRAPEF